MDIKKKRRRIIITIVILIMIIIGILITIYKKSPKYKISTLIDKNSFYYGDNTGEFIEVKENGDIYSHNFNEEAKRIEEKSNLIYITDNGYDDELKQYMLIDKEGGIYIGTSSHKKEKKIGFIPGAVSGDICLNHLVILTREGKVYVYAMNEYGARDLGDASNVRQFTLVTGISKVKKVMSKNMFTVFWSEDGEVYKGNQILNIHDNSIKKVNMKYPVVDVDCDYSSITLFDREGYLYEVGEAFGNGHYYGNFETPQIVEDLKNVAGITQGTSCMVIINNRGKVHYRATKIHGRISYGKYIEGKLSRMNNAECIMASGRYIYAIKNGKVIRTKIEG